VVSQAFVEAVAMMDTASTTVAESTSSQLIAGLKGDDDYGMEKTTAVHQQLCRLQAK